jgi:hypothetical protein
MEKFDNIQINTKFNRNSNKILLSNNVSQDRSDSELNPSNAILNMNFRQSNDDDSNSYLRDLALKSMDSQSQSNSYQDFDITDENNPLIA